ncbi:MAG: hypothetical protein KDE27_07880, partial [Planctomycetes bacterium]|nr:hypothetical protein [Planctomycetota bacterium]
MRTCILFVIALSLSVLARAQARRAFVELGDGTEVTGRVVAMDLKHLQLVVDEQIVTIRAADIKNCRFEEMPEPVGSEQLPPPAPIGETAPPRAELTPAGAASTEGSAVAPAETPTDPDAAVAAGTVSEAAGAGDPAAG